MSADAWITLAVSIITIGLLATDRFPPALVMGGAVTFLLVVGVIDEDGALLGFSNDAPVTVAALYILAGAAEVTGALDGLTARALGTRSTDEEQGAPRRQLARIALPSMAASAFIANTPLVGMLAPRVVAWSRRTGRSPSRYLMPLSYAVVFGGCITLIGTSTNLVVAGLLEDAGFRPLGLFEITPAGLPIALAGTALIVLLAPRLLPTRHAPTDELVKQVREFTVEMVVPAGSTLAGTTVAEAGLRNLEGVYLVAIERDGHNVSPVPPTEVLVGNDRLIFAGNVARILDLQRMAGLESAGERHFSEVGSGSAGRQLFEAVVREGSPLVGSTLKRVGFRSRHGAAVFAVHRAGERIPGKLGDVRLRTGDVLLLVADADFLPRAQDHEDFLVVAPLMGGVPVRKEKALVVQLLTLGLILVAGTGALDLLKTSLVIAIALIAFKVITPGEARRFVDLNIILLMATSFGLGVAMHDSGLAEQIAEIIVRGFDPLGDVGLLAGVLIATMLMTELLSNNAAAVLMFPIALATAQQAGLDPRPFAVVILFGASLSFLTPIGYQANTLVWGLGGYRYRDFSRLGAPLTLATIATALVTVPLVFPLR